MRSVFLVVTLLGVSVACFAQQSTERGENGSVYVFQAQPEIFHQDGDFLFGLVILLDGSADTDNLLVTVDNVKYLVTVAEFKQRIKTTTANLGNLSVLKPSSPPANAAISVYMPIPIDSNMIQRWAARQKLKESQLIATGKKPAAAQYHDISVVFDRKVYNLTLEEFKNRIRGKPVVQVGLGFSQPDGDVIAMGGGSNKWSDVPLTFRDVTPFNQGIRLQSQAPAKQRGRPYYRKPRKLLEWGNYAEKHAHAQAKAVTPPVTPATPPIPLPEPEAAKLREIQAKAAELAGEYQRKYEALQSQWDLTVARAALRAKLSLEQLDGLAAGPDGKGGFAWTPKALPSVLNPVPATKGEVSREK